MIKEMTTFEFWEQLFHTVMDWCIQTLPIVLLLLLLFYVIKRLVKTLLDRFQKRLLHQYESTGDTEGVKRINTIQRLFNSIVIISLNVIMVLIILSQVGINIGPLLAGAGILGLAVGFGSQELVRDVISGFFIIIEDQIRVGDVVMINGVGGGVEKIEVRTITLRDFSGVVHIFQNGKINSLSNMTKTWSAMVFDIGVAYKENTDHVVSVIKKVGAEIQAEEEFKDKIIEPLEIAGVDQFGPSEVVIKARFKTIPGNQWAVGREFRRRLKFAFDEDGIEIPFPHSTIYFGDDSKEGKEKLSGK